LISSENDYTDNYQDQNEDNQEASQALGGRLLVLLRLDQLLVAVLDVKMGVRHILVEFLDLAPLVVDLDVDVLCHVVDVLEDVVNLVDLLVPVSDHVAHHVDLVHLLLFRVVLLFLRLGLSELLLHGAADARGAHALRVGQGVLYYSFCGLFGFLDDGVTDLLEPLHLRGHRGLESLQLLLFGYFLKGQKLEELTALGSTTCFSNC
jgi:hypothetical protein